MISIVDSTISNIFRAISKEKIFQRFPQGYTRTAKTTSSCHETKHQKIIQGVLCDGSSEKNFKNSFGSKMALPARLFFYSTCASADGITSTLLLRLTRVIIFCNFCFYSSAINYGLREVKIVGQHFSIIKRLITTLVYISW